MNDYWHDGYGAGLTGCTWVATVGGRLLAAWERRELADGWRAGLRDGASYTADMGELSWERGEPVPL